MPSPDAQPVAGRGGGGNALHEETVVISDTKRLDGTNY
eukprot:COSAG01_NODE_62450_length_284_cov_1.378378_1_plen_37_part_10